MRAPCPAFRRARRWSASGPPTVRATITASSSASRTWIPPTCRPPGSRHRSPGTASTASAAEIPMSDSALTTVTRTQGNNKALKDGTVRPHGFELQFVEVDPLIDAFRRMVRTLEFDVCEMAMTTFITAREHGKKIAGLPIFLMRAFHHGAIKVNTKAGLSSPKDLEGKRVGVNRGYTVTTGLWARNILSRQYGVDLSKITWVLSGDEHVAEFQRPANVVPIEKGRKMGDLL